MCGQVSQTSPNPPPGFIRTLVQVTNHEAVIRSSCDYCGLQIAAPSSETILAVESEHRNHCGAPKKPPIGAKRV